MKNGCVHVCTILCVSIFACHCVHIWGFRHILYFIFVCVRACARAYVRACVRACVHPCMHACVHASVYISICRCISMWTEHITQLEIPTRIRHLKELYTKRRYLNYLAIFTCVSPKVFHPYSYIKQNVLTTSPYLHLYHLKYSTNIPTLNKIS